MDRGLPLLNCLWQQALRSFCSSNNTSPSKWVYAVFWRILPRNYPPPRWDGDQAFDRSNSNKRNWILVWEDGFCDFNECEAAFDKANFGPEIFFKMSHEVYNYGEGLMGKVAADNSHRWVYREIPSETEPNFLSPWNGSFDSQPRTWELQFDTGIQTIAIVAVKEGVIQLGSLHKVVEELNLVISIQRTFNYLHSIPGVSAMQRPNPATSEYHRNVSRHGMRVSREKEEFPIKSTKFGLNNQPVKTHCQSTRLPLPMSYSLGMLLSRLPCVTPPSSHSPALSSTDSNGFCAPDFFCSPHQNSDVKPQIFEMATCKQKLFGPYSNQSCDEITLATHSQFVDEEQGDVTWLL